MAHIYADCSYYECSLFHSYANASSRFLLVLLPISAAQVIVDSVAFSLGLATTLMILGIAASFAGKAYGQVGQGLPLAASGLAIIMGLNLLEVHHYYPTSCWIDVLYFVPLVTCT